MDEVRDFIRSLQPPTQKATKETIDLLERNGFRLSMPHVKPVGGGLWELRVRTHPAIRILYGFHQGAPVLLVAFKKQKSAIPGKSFERARMILRKICI